MTGLTLIGGAVGAGLMYLLDPRMGRRRRAIARDKVVHAGHKVVDAADVTRRDFANRVTGMVAETRAVLSRQPVSDAVLSERVRARLGSVVSHPSSIEVAARDGRVILRGLVLADEADRLIARVAAVRGVRSVENRLDAHADPAGVPGLQGERFELMQRHWSPTARLIAGTAGAAMTVYGLRHFGLVGAGLAVGGLGLLTRSATNLEFRRLMGRGPEPHAISVQKTIEIDAPVREVFGFWSRWENFPRIMAHVREVTEHDGRVRWTVAGPAGIPVQWDTVVTEQVPDELIAWATVAGSAVEHTGRVRFESTPEGRTRLDVRLSYTPPAGAVGHAVAALFGADPKSAMDADLIRLKSLLEEGKTTAHGERVTRDDLSEGMRRQVS
jgi:uncharacterized membrane protein